MKTIGLIGGMSWESSAEYYKIINEEVKKRLGGLHSAKCILYSVDFDEIEEYQTAGDWEMAGEMLAEIAVSLEKAGADFIIICTNTMHKVSAHVKEEISIPILHIADATANQIKKKGLSKVGLLGTKYTMEQDFYKSRIESQDIEVLVPDEQDRDVVNKVIFEELCLGEIIPTSREYFREVMKHLVKEGAEGIILGCTEIGLLVNEKDADVPLFDTTLIHAVDAVDNSLEDWLGRR